MVNNGALVETLINDARTSPPPDDRIVVGVDECLNDRRLLTMLGSLVRDNVIGMSRSLWCERRILDNGSILIAGGGAATGHRYGMDWGRRVRGDSWPDSGVVGFSVATLFSYRVFVILSANRRGDPTGLTKILCKEVAPLLNADLSHGRVLALLLKKHATTTETYARRIDAYLRSGALHTEKGFVRKIF